MSMPSPYGPFRQKQTNLTVRSHWSTRRFVPHTYEPDETVYPIFTSGQGEVGQGYERPLTVSETSLKLTGQREQFEFKRFQWLLRYAPAETELEDLARVHIPAPAEYEESLFAFLESAYFSPYTAKPDNHSNYLFSSALPAGAHDWKAATYWASDCTVASDPGTSYCVPWMNEWHIRIYFRKRWRPCWPVRLEMILLP